MNDKRSPAEAVRAEGPVGPSDEDQLIGVRCLRCGVPRDPRARGSVEKGIEPPCREGVHKYGVGE